MTRLDHNEHLDQDVDYRFSTKTCADNEVPRDRVSFHIHQHQLEQYLRAGDEVLAYGAATQRYAELLGRIGARVTTADRGASPLRAWNTRSIPDEAFDAVLAYGGALGEVGDVMDGELAEMLRLTRAGGHVLLSVPSLLGRARLSFPDMAAYATGRGEEALRLIMSAGKGGRNGSGCHRPSRLYRWEQLRRMLARHPATVVAVSASNYLTLGYSGVARQLERGSVDWATLLEWELDFCRQPGAIDGGTDIIVVLERHA